MKWGTKDKILMSVVGIVFFLNILLPYSLGMVPIIEELVIVGWTILGIGALFVVISILMLHKKGTSNIVDSGIYGIVRHPMYLGGLIMFFSHIFFFQNWIITINTIMAIVCCYLLIQSEDQRNIKRFGNDYKCYMQSVPRMNFLLGIIRLIKRRKRE